MALASMPINHSRFPKWGLQILDSPLSQERVRLGTCRIFEQEVTEALAFEAPSVADPF